MAASAFATTVAFQSIIEFQVRCAWPTIAPAQAFTPGPRWCRPC